MTDPEIRAINRAICLLTNDYQDTREAARAALHTIFRRARQKDARIAELEKDEVLAQALKDFANERDNWKREGERLRQQLTESQERLNECIDRQLENQELRLRIAELTKYLAEMTQDRDNLVVREGEALDRIAELEAALMEIASMTSGIDIDGEVQTYVEGAAEVARQALTDGQEICRADITDRNDEHRMYVCTLSAGHRTAHEAEGATWTDATHPADGQEI